MHLPLSILQRRQQKQQRKQAFNKAMSIIAAVKKMVDAGAIIFDRKGRRVGIIREMFWDGKDEAWRKNFCQNLHLFMDISRDRDKLGPDLRPIHIHAIDIDKKQITTHIHTHTPSADPESYLT